ncbi:DNA-binding protein [Spiroplasma endosymbiont of Anurida maritima]|uniref:YlxM family DNA-binding protein n=1 Tax=Spiroplasma endosymbiont of Anurida maritima TaxID=2967972 RepID=UPI0036D426CB
MMEINKEKLNDYDFMLKIIALYDIYKELLTDKQKNYFETYYFDNLSLAEISEDLGVSRNAVYDALKTIVKTLNTYESKLKIKEKNMEIEKLVNALEDSNLIETKSNLLKIINE